MGTRSLDSLPIANLLTRIERFYRLKSSKKIFQVIVIPYETINDTPSGLNNEAGDLNKGVNETFELHADNLMTK